MEILNKKKNFLTKMLLTGALCFYIHAAEDENDELNQARARLTTIINSLKMNGGPDVAPTMTAFSDSLSALAESDQRTIIGFFKRDVEEGNDDLMVAQLLAVSCSTPDAARECIAERNRPVVAAPVVPAWNSLFTYAQTLAANPQNGIYIPGFVDAFSGLEEADKMKILAAFNEYKVAYGDNIGALSFLAQECGNQESMASFLRERA